MANITTARAFIEQSRAAQSAEDFLSMARLAVAAQRTARQCRAASRGDVAWLAHNLVAAAQRGATAARDRSIIGGLMAESQTIGWNF